MMWQAFAEGLGATAGAVRGYGPVGGGLRVRGGRRPAGLKADPARRGRIMDRRLWPWTRYPYYFDDFCVWWGLFLIVCADRPRRRWSRRW